MTTMEESAAQATPESLCPSKPRQFHVVHVPGAFTRGRWQCWDYRDDKPPQDAPNFITFEDNHENKENVENEGEEASTSTSASALTEQAGSNTQSPQREESSTIVVTSIAPAPPTPQHGTPSSIEGISSPLHKQHHAAEGAWNGAASSSSASTLTSGGEMSPAAAHLVGGSSGGSTQSQPPPSTVSTPQQHSEMSRSMTEGAQLEDNNAAQSNSIAAIDNKIEQAMDLVKTHLTFAVREEVELLRQTITELESKVSQLEVQNSILRRYVPSEVLSTIPSLVAQHKQSAPVTSAPDPQLLQQEMESPPPRPSSSTPSSSSNYCAATSLFANSLNSVVPPPPLTPQPSTPPQLPH